MKSKYLLTIAIPTYNRDKFLERCLQQIWKQITIKNCEKVQIIVSDNASDDCTLEIVNDFMKNGMEILYLRNKENLGPDKNIFQCITTAQGKYVLILSDDDILLDGTLDKMILLVQNKDYGLVYLESYGFRKDYLLERPKRHRASAVFYDDVNAFLKKVSYYITFVSSNLFNRELALEMIGHERFLGTNLGQISWYISAALGANRNVFVREFCIAAQVENSGGYKLFETFGRNFNKILLYYGCFGMKKSTINFINNQLLMRFFPGNIYMARKKNHLYLNESVLDVLLPTYNQNWRFWLWCVPLFKMPVFLAALWLLGGKIIYKIGKIIKFI